ncbi:arginase family protein [Cellulomonas sp. URHE0023]|uniref:arginase family protein n=1 Tax=Cellulomonas sp. URHE0023 TaxID=1380354 RepID=UPI00068AFF9F|nr:arginase family protein [Cellulomonas sp. URHE0023]
MGDLDLATGPLPVELICAPWSIGLRPTAAGAEPGTWRAPHVLRGAGLGQRLEAVAVTELSRPPYQFEAQPGTRVRNGVTLRQHSLLLADAVGDAVAAGRMPVVVGGDCSVLLGSLSGARRHHQIALVHIDGHPDFTHPGHPDFSGLGAAAGMDLALATGRGELLLTRWPGVDGPLVGDPSVVQIGDRTGQAVPTDLLVIGIHELLAAGVEATAQQAVGHLKAEQPIWVHVDLDVVDMAHLPAVDSPGTPGVTFEQLALLLSRLLESRRIVGVDVTIYDPDLDPDGAYTDAIVDCLAAGLQGRPA